MLICIVNLPGVGGGTHQSFPLFDHKRPLPTLTCINPLPELGEEAFGKCFSETSWVGVRFSLLGPAFLAYQNP